MNFQQSFIQAIQSNIVFKKNDSIHNYLPHLLSISDEIAMHLPYAQAYADIHCAYPYYYEISNLDSFCLVYTESGSGVLTIDSSSYPLIPGTLAFFPCSLNHRIEIKQSPWNYKVFYINGNPIPYLQKSFTSEYSYLHTLPLGSNIPNMIKKFYSHLIRYTGQHYKQAKYISDILYELIIERNREEEYHSKTPEYLIQIKYNFDHHYQESYTLDELELEHRISKYRICREFMQYYDYPPIQYLNKKRIEVAKDSLIHTEKRVNEIGSMVGLENTNHFIRLFKKETGVTPLLYRKQTAKDSDER
ncbi:MAG TPA: AraC family transcriptional regulator [Lachnospiraceae bacterium]|nr:AraC family transcriptional regulator [Lachnospiraceae bacterium]